MTGRCKLENCFADTACALGHIDRTQCEFWQHEDQPGAVRPVETEARPNSDVPWNGFALGTSDLAILSGRGQPLVVGLVGSEGSGKTSLLAFLYMWLLKHGTIADWCFAGSWTLGGWESVVQYCRWRGEPPPSFPPHTSSTGRHPGVLHLTLRHHVSDGMRDVMFTDAPGEWFTHWARVPNDPVSEGARWVIEHSDVLLLLIDSAALADPERLPHARRDTRDLIERVGATAASRTLVVWTKDDILVPPTARSTVARTCAEFLPHRDSMITSVVNAETIERCFVRAIEGADNSGSVLRDVEPRQSNLPFFAFRGIDVNA